MAGVLLCIRLAYLISLHQPNVINEYSHFINTDVEIKVKVS